MKLIGELAIPSGGAEGRIELLVGDLSRIPPEHAVDALMVSAYPGNYAPLRSTVIGALDRRGLSVAELAEDKEVDLLDVSDCWLSRPIDRPDLNFRYLVCFEPDLAVREPTEAVGGVFRSLIPYVTGEPWISSVAVPLLAAGVQEADPLGMLRAILDAAIHWLSSGLPLAVLKIVIYDRNDDLAPEAMDVFRGYARATDEMVAAARRAPVSAYDLFLSYSHVDTGAVDVLLGHLRRLAPGLRIFVDHSELDAGSAWQKRIFAAIEGSQRVVCFYSPDYLESDVCLEEYNIAHMRNREEGGVLVPAYLRTAPRLPSYMRLLQYVDIREGDSDRIEDLARMLVDGIRLPGGAPRSQPAGRSAALHTSDAGVSADITLTAATEMELGKVIDVLTAVGRQLNFDVSARSTLRS